MSLHSLRSASSALRRRRAATLVGVVALTVASGCLGLDVVDPNNLGIETVFTNAANTEAALIGSWKAYTEVNRSSCPTLVYSVWGHDITTTSATYLEFATEPRLPINNRDNVNCATRVPFWTPYEAAAGAREAFIGITTNKLKFGTVNATTPDGADTPNRKLFAKFIIAISQLKLALTNDSAYVTDTISPGLNKTNVKLVGHKDVLANAKAQLRVAIAEAKAGPNFTWPALFINGRTITRDELVRVMYSFLVRAEVYSPRSPAERAAVDWGGVLTLLDSGVTRDFGFQADPAIAGTGSTYINNSFAQNTVRIHNKLLGPADTSGNYQAWIAAPIANRTAFVITTPDRRIHGTTNALPGTRFTRVTATMGSAANGAYLTSWYRSTRYLNTAADSGNRAFIQVISLDEMKFVRAEALYRVGRFAEAAALINPTRVAAGLRPVDANGPPAGRDCVPRKESGACGDLFDAIQYEKRIELYPTEGDIPWFDARGWGKLVPGTPVHVPVSGRELISLGLPYYTFGGIGSPGTAP
jgi:hypothetical protein